MLPSPGDSMQSASVETDHRDRRGGPVVIAALVAVAAWLGCSSPESFRARGGGLSTGQAGGGGGAGATGQAGMPGTDGGALAGDNGAAGSLSGVAGDSGGPAGTNGAAGAAGSGAAGSGAAGSGAAGSGAAGSGAAGSGAAGAGAAGSGAAGSGAAGSGAAGSGAAGAAGSSTAGTGGAAPPALSLALPVTVSDHFVPTGGMGDAVVAGAVTLANDVTACSGEPAAANKGTCYTITYHPQPIVAPAPSTWAGFYWQYPANNWGALQPQVIAAGAKDISFYAKGMAGGESITFEAGGISNTVSTATPFTDSFTVTQTLKLTTTWTKYTLSMTGLTYRGGVLGGFAWVASAMNANPITFFVHGIVWE
jgi:hypothetical protein